MGLRETWNEMDTAVQLLVGLGVAFVASIVVFLFIVVVLPFLAVVAIFVLSFVLALGDAETAAPEAPQVSMDFEYDDGDETVTITHDGGDAIEASAIVIEAGDRPTNWDDPDGEITTGDSTTVRLYRGESLSVVWEGEDSAVLAEFEAPS